MTSIRWTSINIEVVIIIIVIRKLNVVNCKFARGNVQFSLCWCITRTASWTVVIVILRLSSSSRMMKKHNSVTAAACCFFIPGYLIVSPSGTWLSKLKPNLWTFLGSYNNGIYNKYPWTIIVLCSHIHISNKWHFLFKVYIVNLLDIISFEQVNVLWKFCCCSRINVDIRCLRYNSHFEQNSYALQVVTCGVFYRE